MTVRIVLVFNEIPVQTMDILVCDILLIWDFATSCQIKTDLSMWNEELY